MGLANLQVTIRAGGGGKTDPSLGLMALSPIGLEMLARAARIDQELEELAALFGDEARQEAIDLCRTSALDISASIFTVRDRHYAEMFSDPPNPDADLKADLCRSFRARHAARNAMHEPNAMHEIDHGERG